MRNFTKDGKTWHGTIHPDVVSGDVVAMENVVMVATGDAKDGEQMSFDLVGIFKLPIASGVALKSGEILNFDPDLKEFVHPSVTPDTGFLLGAGIAYSATLAPDTSCNIAINKSGAEIEP